MLKFKATLLLVVSFNVAAQTTNKAMVCPSLTNEGSSIITSIQGLQNLVKPLPECAQITEKLGVISEVMDGKPWDKITKALKEETEFDGKDLETISALTEKASMALNDVIGQVTNNRNCVDNKNSASFMSKLSGVVKEVSTVVGTVSGPYGMAVSLGGSLISSAITGIDKYYKARHPYNFSNQDEELLFMNQFCSYAEIQKDINDYLTLNVRHTELDSLEDYLKIKQADLEANCPECLGQSIASKAHEKSQKILAEILKDANIVPLGPDENFTRCHEIQRAIHSSDSDLNQFITLLSTYENPASSASNRSLVKEVVESAKSLSSIYPELSECYKLPLKEKQRISLDFNNLMRDEFIPLGDSVFRQEMTGLKMRANKKFVNPLGDYTERTLLRRAWRREQYAEVRRKLNDPNYDSSVSMIITQKQRLEGRIFDELMVDYLKFIQKRNKKKIQEFSQSYQSFMARYLYQYSDELGREVTSIKELKVFLEKNPKIKQSLFQSELAKQEYNLELMITQTATFDRYCQFMDYMRLSTQKTTATCDESKLDLEFLYSQVSAIDDATKERIEKFKWLVPVSNYQSSRVKDFSVHLQEWIAEGNARWELKDSREIAE